MPSKPSFKAGHQDPLLTLAELQAKSTDEGIRATAVNTLAPFMHSKCGAMPPLRFISEPIELPFPNPITLEEINANTSYLDQALAAGTLDIDFHTALCSPVNASTLKASKLAAMITLAIRSSASKVVY